MESTQQALRVEDLELGSAARPRGDAALLQQIWQSSGAAQPWLTALVQSSPDLIAIAGLSGDWQFLNQAGQRWLGEGATSLSQSLLDVDRDYFQTKVVPAVLQSGQWRGQLRFQHDQTHAIVMVDSQWFVLLDANSQPLCLATVSQVVATASAPPEAPDAQLVAKVVHDLRSPLAVIASSAGLLQSLSHNPDKVQKHCQRIQRKIEQMTHLIDDLLWVSRIEQAAVLPRQQASIDLAQLCAELVEEAQQTSDRHRIVFSQQDEAATGFTAQLEETWMQRIVSNLLGNSLKYSPQGGTIAVFLTRHSQQVTLQVQDEGIGIPASEQPHLFESFYRAENTGQIAGTGLGLAIVKRCLDLQGGTIAIQSTVGQGTTVTVTLPV
jgi:signal transduction histidine kinase